MEKQKILIFGYENPGMQDDAVGNIFVDKFEEWVKQENIENISFDSNYQLNIEDAEAISKFDMVIFVDASVEDIEDIAFTKVSPKESKIEFTMHAVAPSFILELCNRMYSKMPITYLLHIKVYEMEFMGEITNKAISNLNKAIDFVKENVKTPESFESLYR